MAIAAQRFKFLDKETNVPTIDFTTLADNAVYNNMSDIIDSAIAEAKQSDNIIEKVSSDIQDLQGLIAGASGDVLDSLQDALNIALDTIGSMDLPDIAKDIFASLKKLDPVGVGDFLKDMLNIGSPFLCNNLDFLKMFMLGYALNKNVVAGLLTACMLSWMDKFCKGYSPAETKGANPIKKLQQVVSPKGLSMTPDNTFNNFTKSYSGYLKNKEPITTPPLMSEGDFITTVTGGDVNNTMKSLRDSEMDSETKARYLQLLDDNLESYPTDSDEYYNLLEARGSLVNLPPVSEKRRDKSIRYDNLSDNLGSMAKNIKNVDLTGINKFNLSDTEKGLYDKIAEFKLSSGIDSDLSSRDLSCGAYDDYDFDKIMPTPTADEVTYLDDIDEDDSCHRLADLHPTSEVIMDGFDYA